MFGYSTVRKASAAPATPLSYQRTRFRLIAVVAAALASVSVAGVASAQTNQWLGTTGTSPVNWTADLANWSLGIAPISTHDVDIDRTGSRDSAIDNSITLWQVASLRIRNNNVLYHRNSNANIDLEVLGDMTIDSGGEFVFRNNRALTDVFINGSLLGAGTMTQVANGGYLYLQGAGETFSPLAASSNWENLYITGSYTMTGDLDVSGANDFQVSGSLDIGANQLTIAAWPAGGGTLDLDAGTVVMTGGTIPAGVTFNNLVIDTGSVTLAGDLTVLGDLTFTSSGDLDMNGFDADIEGDVTMANNCLISGTWDAINIGGSLDFTGNATKISGSAGARVLTLDNSTNSPNTITAENANQLSNLTIVNAASNVLNNTSTLAIGVAFTNNGTLQNSTGTTFTFSDDVTVGATGTLDAGTSEIRFAQDVTVASGGTVTTTGNLTFATSAFTSNVSIAAGATWSAGLTRVLNAGKTVTLAGDVYIDAGALSLANNSTTVNVGAFTLDVPGGILISGGNTRSLNLTSASSVVNCGSLTTTTNNSVTFSSSGTINITGGNYTQAASLTAGTGTFNLTNVPNWSTGNRTYYNVNVLSGTVTASGTHDFNGSLSISNGATLNTAGVAMTIAGNAHVDGTLTGPTTITLDGTGGQTIRGTFPILTVSNTGAPQKVTTSGDTTVAGVLSVTTGTLRVTSGYVLTASSTLSVSGGATTEVAGSGDMRVAGTVSHSGTHTMEAGSVLRLSATTHGFSSFNATGSGAARAVITRNGVGNYRMNFASGGTVDVTTTDFQYLDTNGSAGITLAGAPAAAAPSSSFNFVTFRYASGSSFYMRVNSTNYANRVFTGLAFRDDGIAPSTVENSIATQVVMDSYSTSGAYVFGPSTSSGLVTWNVTAAEMVYAAAKGLRRNNTVRVEWLTASEADNLGFRVARASSPNGPWTLASDFIAGAGTSNTANAYQVTDYLGGEAVVAGDLWYRIEDIDFNGISTYHTPVRVMWIDALDRQTPRGDDVVTGSAPRDPAQLTGNGRPTTPARIADNCVNAMPASESWVAVKLADALNHEVALADLARLDAAFDGVEPTAIRVRYEGEDVATELHHDANAIRFVADGDDDVAYIVVDRSAPRASLADADELSRNGLRRVIPENAMHAALGDAKPGLTPSTLAGARRVMLDVAPATSDRTVRIMRDGKTLDSVKVAAGATSVGIAVASLAHAGTSTTVSFELDGAHASEGWLNQVVVESDDANSTGDYATVEQMSTVAACNQ